MVSLKTSLSAQPEENGIPKETDVIISRLSELNCRAAYCAEGFECLSSRLFNEAESKVGVTGNPCDQPVAAPFHEVNTKISCLFEVMDRFERSLTLLSRI